MSDYEQGFIDGLRCYAWWKDSKQVCGTGETPLDTAIKCVKTMWNYIPPVVKTYQDGLVDGYKGCIEGLQLESPRTFGNKND